MFKPLMIQVVILLSTTYSPSKTNLVSVVRLLMTSPSRISKASNLFEIDLNLSHYVIIVQQHKNEPPNLTINQAIVDQFALMPTNITFKLGLQFARLLI